MANTKGIRETIKCPNGFYFGDPCYALREDLYDEWINWGDENQAKDGKWDNSGKFVFEGKDIMIVDSTAYGDGCYQGTQIMPYGVDAGCLAVIPLEYCDETKSSFDDGGWINRNYCGTVELETGIDGSFLLTDKKTRLQLEYVETGDIEEEEDDEETREFWDEGEEDED